MDKNVITLKLKIQQKYNYLNYILIVLYNKQLLKIMKHTSVKEDTLNL